MLHVRPWLLAGAASAANDPSASSMRILQSRLKPLLRQLRGRRLASRRRAAPRRPPDGTLAIVCPPPSAAQSPELRPRHAPHRYLATVPHLPHAPTWSSSP